MARFVQNAISVRFLEILDELIDKQTVKNMAEFSKRTGHQLQSLSQIKQGRRNVTIDLVSKLFTEFNGSPIYLLSGKGNKILDDVTLSMVEEGTVQYGKASGNDKTVRMLEDLVQTKNEIIKMLKEENARYKQKEKKRNTQE